MTKELDGEKPTVTFTHPLPFHIVLTFLQLATISMVSAREDRLRMMAQSPGSDLYMRWERLAIASEKRAVDYRRAADPALASLWKPPTMPAVDPLPFIGPCRGVDQIAAWGAELARAERAMTATGVVAPIFDGVQMAGRIKRSNGNPSRVVQVIRVEREGGER